MIRSSFLLSALLSFSLCMHAQEIPQKLRQAKWVKIMSNDSAYNFLEAEEEFQKYYTAYIKEKKKEENRKNVNPEHAAEEHMKSPLELLVSQYQKWSVTIRPFVLKDGSIIPLQQRLKIIQDARNKQLSAYQ